MKLWIIALGFLGFWMTPMSTASAAWTEWPVVSQVTNVVRCVVTDAGAITGYWISAAVTATTQTLTRVGQCLLYVTDEVTDFGDPNPTHEEPHG